MDFKSLFSNRILIFSVFATIVIGTILCLFLPKAEAPAMEGDENAPPSQIESIKYTPVEPAIQNPDAQKMLSDDAEIQQQLDRDREDQRQTKYLKTKLEQTDLELEQEKALAEINKLKMENMGTFKEPALEGQNGFPEVKVQYIGGDSLKKEAILSIAGSSYQVKEKSSPTDTIQVMSISDSSVTLHFSAPQELTKTIDYKPE